MNDRTRMLAGDPAASRFDLWRRTEPFFFAVISTGAPDLSGAERRNLFPAEQGPKYQTEKISPLRGCAAPVEMTGSK
ncbi:MAG: hypothetical protein F4160_14300 [Rhodospirillaceae bacterium]|nr:hypothetical protein [Rhodospirillaceae bacterium]MYH37956.1 hypothetical protein [Rhodospirillaceae bacterium]MYK15273.1 hypothetical protein [Rhodospirillaceae bacterium]